MPTEDRQPITVSSPAGGPKYDSKTLEAASFFKKRKTQLIDARKDSGMEERWKQADYDYEPHVLGTENRKKVLVENERTESSAWIRLDKDAWRSKQSSNNVYQKVQTALSVILDRQPEGVFNPASKKYERSTALISALYHRLWAEPTLGTTEQWRKYIFNKGKYGIGTGRRYHRKEVREVEHIVEYDAETDEYKTQPGKQTDVDDVYFETLSPWTVWIDDAAKPDDRLSINDWMWKKVYTEDQWSTCPLSRLPAFKDVQFREQEPEEEGRTNGEKRLKAEKVVVVWYYENKARDLFCVEANDRYYAAPLPYEHKQLSLVTSYWTLRSSESVYGIGVHEAMRGNHVLYNQVKNMSVDQLVLSIFKMFFYQLAEQIDTEGGETIKIEPGVGKKVLDPKNISFLDVPGPGQEAWQGLAFLEGEIEKDTGISPTLTGEITGKTAFEVARAKESALKRLAIPYKSLKSAMEWDAWLAVKLMQQIYSVPEVVRLVEPDQVADYLAEVQENQAVYAEGDDGIPTVSKYREFQLGLEQQGEGGDFQAADEKQFFTVKPEWLQWEGTVSIKMDSIVVQSQELEKEQTMTVFNIVTPLLTNPQIDPTLYEKPLGVLLKAYNYSVKDWVPDGFFEQAAAMKQMQQQMMMAQAGQPPPGQAQPGGAEEMPLIVPQDQTQARSPVQQNSQMLQTPMPK